MSSNSMYKIIYTDFPVVSSYKKSVKSRNIYNYYSLIYKNYIRSTDIVRIISGRFCSHSSMYSVVYIINILF